MGPATHESCGCRAVSVRDVPPIYRRHGYLSRAARTLLDALTVATP